MKKLFFALFVAIMLSGCVGWVLPKVATPEETRIARTILWENGYQLIDDVVEFYASSFDRADVFYGRAYYKGTAGYVMVNKRDEKPEISWSETKDFRIVTQ